MKLAAWILLCGSWSLIPVGVAQAAWQDWWQTPEQQAARAFENGDHEALLQIAPDTGWTGLGQYQAGDFQAAAKSFAEQARQQQMDGNVDAANRMRFNQGVSEVKAGRYDEAINQFDGVLEADPEFEEAAQNREIAEQLKALAEKQEQQGDQEGDQEGDQQGEQESGDESGGASDESSTSQKNEAEEQAAAENARRALEAEARQESSPASESEEAALQGNERAEARPLSEGEQATEQLLRRIPDDPAGLLRRKLEQSHRSEYPEVRDAREPW